MKSRLADAWVGVAHRLCRAAEEHGVPNSFSFSELVGSREAMLAGKSVRRHWPEFVKEVQARTKCLDEVRLDGGRLMVL